MSTTLCNFSRSCARHDAIVARSVPLCPVGCANAVTTAIGMTDQWGLVVRRFSSPAPLWPSPWRLSLALAAALAMKDHVSERSDDRHFAQSGRNLAWPGVRCQQVCQRLIVPSQLSRRQIWQFGSWVAGSCWH